jgi:hypothetical protein
MSGHKHESQGTSLFKDQTDLMTAFLQRGFLLHLAHKLQPIHDIAIWGVNLSRKAKQCYRFGGKCCLYLQR